MIKFRQNWIQAGGKKCLSTIHELVNFKSSEEELPDEWKESIIASIHKEDVKAHLSTYWEISLLSTWYNILLNTPLRLSPHVEEISADHPCGFRRNRSTSDQIFCISQILGEKW
jgi:hypothetical protein